MHNDASQLEWLAWLQFCAQLKELGVDINAGTSGALHRSIMLWGERLSALRAAEPAHADKALREAIENYAPYELPWSEVSMKK